MARSVDQLGKAIVAAGVMPADELKALWGALPAKERPRDGETFAALLVRQGKLTEFQSQELLSGSTAPLVLGDYVLLARIGAGGMGQVFKAQHRHMERLVAIKLLPPAMTKDAAAVQRFQREVKAAARLVHPNIVQAYDASVQKGVWYLVMEYVEGRDLSSVVAHEGPLPVARAIDYVRQAARGLAFAHESGVVHRDIKPANLLLDKKGTVKILDMGLARFDNDAALQDGLTQSGQVMGTVDYMAPEQAFDTRSADARADVYSLGCTLYRLVTGKNLYDGETLVQKLMQHQSAPIPPLLLGEAAPTRAFTELNVVFQRMVAKRPEDRYPSMAEAEAALAEIASAPAGGSTAGPADSKLTTFFRALGGGAKPSTATLASPPSAPAAPELSPTINLAAPQASTDPVSERSIQIAREKTPPPQAKARPLPLWKQPLPLAAAGLGAALLLALGMWLIVRSSGPDRAAAPDGGALALHSSSSASTSLTPYEILTSPDYEWTPPENLGPAVNTEFAQRYPTLSADGRRLIYRSFAKPPGLYEAIRASVDEPFGQGKWLGRVFDRSIFGTALAADGLTLLFGSRRSDGATSESGTDLWQATRPSLASPFGQPVWLTALGSPADNPVLSRDGLTIWFRSDRSGGRNGALWTSRRPSLAAEFEQPAPFALPLAPGAQWYHHISGHTFSADECVLIFSADWRGPNDLFLSLRSSPQEPFGTPVNLGPAINSEQPDVHPCLSADGKTLIFSSDRPGGLGGGDLWMTRRVPKASKAAATVLVPRTPLPDGPALEMAGKLASSAPRVRLVAAAPDGAHAALAVDYGVRWKKLATDELVWDRPLPGFGINALAISPDGQRTAVGGAYAGGGEKAVYLLRNDDGTLVHTHAAEAVVFSVAFSPDGSQLAVGLETGAIQLLDVTTGRVRLTLAAHAKEARALAFSGDGSRLASGASTSYDAAGQSNSLKLWSTVDGAEIPTGPAPRETSYYTLRYLTDGATLAAGTTSHDGELRRAGEPLVLVRNPKNQSSRLVAPAPSGTHVVFGGNHLFVFDQASGRVAHEFADHAEYLESLDVTPDGRFALVVPQRGREVEIWRLPPECWVQNSAGTAPSRVAAPLPADKTLVDPAFQTWLAATQKLPAEKQLEAVSKKLMELNPGFDGELIAADGQAKPAIENGVVTGIGFNTDHVTNIAPIRALNDLRSLACRGTLSNSAMTGKLADLSPLQGLPLTSLRIGNNPIVDLSPLRGMPLKQLAIYETYAGDLSPLVGMPLEDLAMNGGWKVKGSPPPDIAHLRGLPLKRLSMNNKPVSDLSPLTGMKLESLSIASTQVSEISVLRGMPLASLELGNTKVADLSPLHECRTLKTLRLQRSSVSPAEIAKLQSALPQCQVILDGDPSSGLSSGDR